MTDLDLSHWRALAEKATKGPWAVFDEQLPFYVWTADYETYIASCWVSEETEAAKADAAYIASLSPDRLLALLDRTERLEAENQRLTTERDHAYRQIAGIHAAVTGGKVGYHSQTSMEAAELNERCATAEAEVSRLSAELAKGKQTR